MNAQQSRKPTNSSRGSIFYDGNAVENHFSNVVADAEAVFSEETSISSNYIESNICRTPHREPLRSLKEKIL